MSADEHIQPKQLTMFEQVKDLIDPSQTIMMDMPASMGDNIDFFLEQKLEESKTGDYENTRKRVVSVPLWHHLENQGLSAIRKPIQIDSNVSKHNGKEYKRVWNGHHRLAVAADLDPEAYLAVEWVDDTKNFKPSNYYDQ